jgi:hypothetical protein
MKIEIKHRLDQSILFSVESKNIKLAVEAAIKAKANLRFASLGSASLRSADLRSADLRSADLRSADLRSADLRSADLRFASLGSADLRSADLRFADLRSADLRFASLGSADLRSADLRSADLRFADPSSADLRFASLGSADLRFADLRSAEMDDNCRIETGETWGEYKTQTVPALLQAGGKELLAVIEASWECHSWENCPMAIAFGVHEAASIPILYRPRAEQFIKYFDAGMLKKEEVSK